MVGILVIIALVFLVAGTLLVLYTEWTRNAFKSIIVPAYVRWYSVVPLVVGVFFVSAAFYHREVFWLALILGVIGIAKGIYLIVGPAETMESVLTWWNIEASDRTVRFFGLITTRGGGQRRLAG